MLQFRLVTPVGSFVLVKPIKLELCWLPDLSTVNNAKNNNSGIIMIEMACIILDHQRPLGPRAALPTVTPPAAA